MRQIMEKSYEYAKNLHMVLINYKQAYKIFLKTLVYQLNESTS